MKKIKLNDSGVLFKEDTHQYFLGGEELRGITSTLLHTAFPDKYLGVSTKALDHAADRGKLVHRALKDYFDGAFVQPGMADVGEEVKKLFSREGLTPIAWEYIVTDGKEFASPIDILAMGQDGGLSIIDTKTTSTLDYSYVAYQTAIYERFFRLQNPDLQVARRYALWVSVDDDFKFRSRPRLERLPAVSDSALDELADAYHAGTTFNPMMGYKEFPDMVRDACAQVVEYVRQQEEASQRVDELKERLLYLMQQYDIKKFTNGELSLTVVPEIQTRRFDSTRFKKEHQNLYDEYTSTSTRAAYLKITITKK